MKQIGAALANYGKKAVSKISNQRQLVVKDFLDQLNPPRIARGMKPLSPGFVGMKMRFMTTSEMKVFIASEIQSAVEAERRRISEEVGKMYDRCTDWDALKEILSIINPKK